MQEIQALIKQAFKQNIIPALILQSFALSIALCYFYWPAAKHGFDVIAQLRDDYGWRFAAISTAFFGGLLPFLYLFLSSQVHASPLRLLSFYILFWSYRGIEVSLLYKLQAYLFGNDANFVTILCKVLFDQLVYSLFWAAPSIILCYIWRDLGFNFNAARKAWAKPELWRLHIPSVIASNWLIWFPAVAIIYTMPASLQLPLFNIVLCFFVLLIASLSKNHQQDSAN